MNKKQSIHKMTAQIEERLYLIRASHRTIIQEIDNIKYWLNEIDAYKEDIDSIVRIDEPKPKKNKV